VTLKTKLYSGVVIIFVVTSVLLFILISIHNNLLSDMEDVINTTEKRQLAVMTQADISEMERKLAMLFLIRDPVKFDQMLDQVQMSKVGALASLEELESKSASAQIKETIIRIRLLLDDHNEVEKEVIDKLREAKYSEAALIIDKDLQMMNDVIIPLLESIGSQQEKVVSEAMAQSGKEKRETIIFGLLLTIMTVSTGIVLTLRIISNISGQLDQVTAVMAKAGDHSYEQIQRIEMNSKDEIGAIAAAYNRMVGELEHHAQLNRIHQQELEDDSWLKSHLAQIASGCQGAQDPSDLAESVITYVAPLVGASYAAIYIKDNLPGAYLRKQAAYAYDGEEIGRETVRVGEGLIGQCAADGKALSLSNLPDSYLRIHSGLGEAAPGYLLLLPVSYENKVMAVIELAAFAPFGSREQELLAELVNDLGIAIDSVLGHMKIKELLAESQLLTEELQSQAEELQSQAEELQLQQEELRTANELLEGQYRQAEQKTEALEQIKDDLEKKAIEVQIASNVKSEFLANMSHELRTPLNSLLILAKLLYENKEGTMTEAQIEFARTIHSSGSDLLQLINDLLDLVKMESGKMEAYSEECSVEELVMALKGQFQYIAEQKQLEFVIAIDPDTKPTLLTDMHRLHQIISNLLSNAFKFTSVGFVRLDVFTPAYEQYGKLEPLQQPGLDVIAFSVSDSGIGIPPDKHEMVFEAFQQADGSTSRSFGGTGLGLSICRQLAKLLGGAIALDSSSEQGSRFTLYLPTAVSDLMQQEKLEQELELAVREAAPASEMILPVEPGRSAQRFAPVELPLAGKQVLIVDDDMRNVFALTTALEAEGMKVQFVENGGEAIEAMREGTEFDIVLMDIMMPHMDGYEAMRQIRSMPQWKELPIIALTAKAMKDDRDKCIEAGASDYISKPIQLEQLLSLLRVWLYR
jgi:two-component system chemotaxis sensor kinase CheA